MAAKRILVLHSGGMDSTVCLYAAAKEVNSTVLSLGVDYGQSLRVELMFAEAQAKKIGVERKVLQVSWDKPRRSIPLNRTLQEIHSEKSTAFLPGRNLLFLSLAVAEAEGIEADEVHLGINCIDFSGYPDCTPAFLEAFREVHLAAGGKSKIIAPLLNKSKPEIAAMARTLGITEFDTWSCYRPQIHDGKVEICEACDACKLHEYAWRGLR